MEPKEKAKELVEKFDETLTYLESKLKAKECALIVCDEFINDHYCIFYWMDVKTQIEKL